LPNAPKGERRPADVIGNAVRVAQIATGEVEEEYEAPPAREERSRRHFGHSADLAGI
jgi:hypothetical protein